MYIDDYFVVEVNFTIVFMMKFIELFTVLYIFTSPSYTWLCLMIKQPEILCAEYSLKWV
jgi:hypothetical protein